MDKQARRIGRKALRVLQETDKEISKRIEQYGSSCTPGCNSCCSLVIEITLAEAFTIADHVLSDIALSSQLTRTLERFYEQLGLLSKDGMSKRNYFLRRKPCAFLNTESGRCSIYKVRPAGCRSYVVVSDPEKCSPDSKDTVKRHNNVDLNLTALGKFNHSLRQQGIPDGLYPLQVAVLWALKILGQGDKGLYEALQRTTDTNLSLEYWDRHSLPAFSDPE